MSKLHYFQRYSQRENVVTNNTLLLLSRLYAHDPTYLEAFLNALVQTGEVEIGPSFTQQAAHGGTSVPDGLIEQKSLKIVVETKRHADARLDQLEEHLKAFDKEDTQVLLLLTPGSPEAELRERLRAATREFNLTHWCGVVDICASFNEVIQILGDTLAGHDYEMRDVLEDYESFCFEEELLPRKELWMRAVPCGKSLEDNLELGLYYQPIDRAYREHRYLGFYKDKKIQGIGKVNNVVVVEQTDGGLSLSQDDQVSEKRRKDIEHAVQGARDKYGWDIATGHRFFLVEEVHDTDFRKQSAGGMRGPRYFDLSEILGEVQLPPPREIAERLSEETW